MKTITLILIFFINITATANTQISNLITPVKYFVNHEVELDHLYNKLLLHKKAGLVGISGIGKTQFARMYAYKNQGKYNIIWFFDCNADLSEQFVQLAKELNQKICIKEKCTLAEHVASAQQSVIKYLTPKNDWLLIFDNVKINENQKLSDIIKWEHNGHVIISSQDGKNIPNSIQVPYLKEADAISLAGNILDKKEYNAIKKLVSTFKGYPVLITQAAIFLETNKYISLEEYGEILAQSDDKMRNHMDLVKKELTPSAQNLLYKIAMINNQKFSKALIKIIADNKTFLEDLQSISRFGLISLVYDAQDKQIFEMHDTVRKSVIEIAGNKMLKDIIEENIDSINKIMPKGKNSRQLLISADDTLLSNLQQLLNNAEYYNANIYKIMELRKNLMSFYVGLGSNLCQEMESWFFQNKGNINSIFMSNYQKAVYAEYLVLIGVYECYLKASLTDGIKCFKEAAELINSINGYFELKFMTYSQLAQAYVFNGDQNNTKIYLQKSEEIVDKIPDNLDVILLWFTKSKSDLSEGKYAIALTSIQKAIELAKHLPQDYYVFPLYTLEAEILNYMSEYNAAYEITNRIYGLEIGQIKDGNAGGYRIRVIVELARAELGLGKLEQSLNHAKEAIYIYKNDKSRNNTDINISKDTDLASALVIEAEALVALNQTEEAAQSFATAETIFYNNYRDNINNLDNISYLYLKAALATCNLPDSFWYIKFSTQLIEKFGEDHFRSKELLTKCQR